MTLPTDRRLHRCFGLATQAGFTLIEVLVVVVILGLVAGLVLQRGPLRSAGLDLRTQASQMGQALRRARAAAIVSNRSVAFVLDGPAHSFRVGDGAPRPIPASVTVMFSTAGVPIGARPGTIVFAPDGSASGGSIALTAGASRTQLDVDWLTGRVSVAHAK